MNNLVKGFQLSKSERFNLTKDSDSTLKIVRAELSWETPENIFPPYDLDVSMFGLANNGVGPKLVKDDYFIFYNHINKSKDASQPIVTLDESIIKSPDEQSGGVEWIKILLDKVDSRATEFSFVVTIHEAIKRKQNFGKVTDAKISIFNDETNELICYFQLDDTFKSNTSVQIGSLLKQNNDWIFEAVGSGWDNYGLEDFLNIYS
ncbi:MAG: TerD family protein [Nitrososphaeraceae archaeon]